MNATVEAKPTRLAITVLVDVHDEALLRRVAAERAAGSPADGSEPFHAGEELGGLAYRVMVGSDPGRLDPAVTGFEIVEVESSIGKIPPDLWDSSDTATSTIWFRQMPEDTIDALLTAEDRDMIYILEDEGGFWLSEDGVAGQERHATLAAAKRSGDRTVAEAEAAQFEALVRDLGLSTFAWTAAFGNGMLVLSRTADGSTISLDMDSDDGSQSWYAAAPDGTDLGADLPTVEQALGRLPSY